MEVILDIDGVIGSEAFGGDFALADAREALQAKGISRIVANIDSPGGSVFEGLAIYNLLREHSAAVEVRVNSLAASIASVIAMAGDNIVMASNALMMIHNPQCGAYGDAESMRKARRTLEATKSAIVKTYAARTGLPAEEISRLMDAETWFDAEEAIEKGFADNVSDDQDAKPMTREASNLVRNYRHTPVAITNRAKDAIRPRGDFAQASAELSRTERIPLLDARRQVAERYPSLHKSWKNRMRSTPRSEAPTTQATATIDEHPFLMEARRHAEANNVTLVQASRAVAAKHPELYALWRDSIRHGSHK